MSEPTAEDGESAEVELVPDHYDPSIVGLEFRGSEPPSASDVYFGAERLDDDA